MELAIDRKGQVYSASEDVFEPRGQEELQVVKAFTRVLPAAGLDLRQDQRRMAVAVERVLARGDLLLADAGVGIGKSFAYLAPILLNGQGFYVVSTSTLVLQDQLAGDVARLADLLGVPRPRTIVSKGQEHYACRYRLEHKVQSSGASIPQEIRKPLEGLLRRLEQIHLRVDQVNGADWTTQTLDALDVPPDLRPHARVQRLGGHQADRSLCDNCEYERTCGFRSMEFARQNPEWNDILVVNHGLLLHDLDQRLHGRRPLWPTPEGIVIDEAHDLEPKVRTTLTRRLNPIRVDALVEPLRRYAPLAADVLGQLVKEAKALAKVIQHARKEYIEPNADRIPVTQEVRHIATRISDTARRALTRVWTTTDRFATRQETVERAERGLDEWAYVGEQVGLNSQKAVTAIEGQTLTAAPVSVDGWLQSRLFRFRAEVGDGFVPVVLCSGSLLAGGTFAELQETLGVPKERMHQLRAPSPFDYSRRMMILASNKFPYVPKAGDKGEENYINGFLVPMLKELVKASRGRALILSTSRRRARWVFQGMKDEIPYATLWQEDRGAVERFWHDIHSVLIGTGKLFAGVDVPGESLSLVVLDRIPFPVPDDPLYEAKRRLDESKGKTELETQWSWARTALAQAAGRLIRTLDDWGVFAIIDPRAAPGGKYHNLVREVLPPGTWVDSPDTIRQFFQQGPGSVQPRDPDPEIATAIRYGQAPRFCVGVGADTVRMLRSEDPYVRVCMVSPGATAPSKKSSDAAVLCAGSPHLQQQIEACRTTGLDIAVASLRGGPLLELLEAKVRPSCSGKAYPTLFQPFPRLRAHFSQGTEDELDLAEFIIWRYPGHPAVIVLPDEDSAITVREYLQESECDLQDVELYSLATAAASPRRMQQARIVALLLESLNENERKLEDLAMVLSVLSFDGRPRGLLVRADKDILMAMREALGDPSLGCRSQHELLPTPANSKKWTPSGRITKG